MAPQVKLGTDALNDFIRLMMQQKFSDISLNRQMQTLKAQEAMYGREGERRLAQNKELIDYQTEASLGASRERLADEARDFLMKQPPIRQLQIRMAQAQTPEERAQFETQLAEIGERFGGTAEKILAGESPTAEEMSYVLQVTDGDSFLSFLREAGTNVRFAQELPTKQKEAETGRMNAITSQKRLEAETGTKGGGTENRKLIVSDAADTLKWLREMERVTTEDGQDLYGGIFTPQEWRANQRRLQQIKAKAMGKGWASEEELQADTDWMADIYDPEGVAAEKDEKAAKDQAHKDASEGLGREQIVRSLTKLLTERGVPADAARQMAEQYAGAAR